MALIVEDGTIVAGAESYVSVADADTYNGNRGNATWTAATVASREESLRKAADYLVQSYRARWQGNRKSALQSLDWPRNDVAVDGFAVASNVVPDAVKNASAELAARALSADLAPDLSRGGQVIKEKVGSLEIQYSESASPSTVYPVIDDALSPYLSGSSNSVKLIRN